MEYQHIADQTIEVGGSLKNVAEALDSLNSRLLVLEGDLRAFSHDVQQAPTADDSAKAKP